MSTPFEQAKATYFLAEQAVVVAAAVEAAELALEAWPTAHTLRVEPTDQDYSGSLVLTNVLDAEGNDLWDASDSAFFDGDNDPAGVQEIQSALSWLNASNRGTWASASTDWNRRQGTDRLLVAALANLGAGQ